MNKPEKVQLRGILTIIGGFLLHFSMGNLYSFGLLNPFYISYLNSYDSNLVVDDGFFLMPLGIASFSIFTIVGGFIDKRLGVRG